MSWFVTTSYHFLALSDLDFRQVQLQQSAQRLGVTGLLILGPEGFNMTCAAPSLAALEEWKSFLGLHFGADLFFKDSQSDVAPFRMFKIKQRQEIVTAGIPGIMPTPGKNHHLNAEEWNRVLKEDKNALILDTRNWYEYQIGTFQGAVNPDIEKFTEFPQWLEQQGYDKTQKMLIFCTGGIRCEKGILELQRRGYDNVYQLEGGILKYLEESPHDQFTGECFVFDHRVALDQDLKPSSRYKLCPHCGNPAEIKIQCARCDTETLLCPECTSQETCSKNCAHWWELYPGKKGQRQIPQGKSLHGDSF